MDFTPEVMKEIDELKDDLGLKSRTEMIRYAVGLLKTVSEMKRDGYSMQFKKGDEIVAIVLPI